MPEELTDQEKMRKIPWSISFSATSSVFGALTLFGPVFVLFLNELGLPKTRIGFILSLLPFAGLLALFIASSVARIGVKRVFVAFYLMRKIETSLLILTPWVLSRYGNEATFIFVTLVVGAFALCRATAETAIYPWFHEIVPEYFRGRYHGISHIIGLLASALALAAASYVMDNFSGLGRFQILVGAGVAFGLLSVLCVTQVPGGAPRSIEGRKHFGSIRQALGDRDLLLYLLGMGLVLLFIRTVVMSFIPLFMKEQVGLTNGQILLIEVGSYTAGLLSSYLWGWAADHAGSKSVTLLALSLMLILPVWLMLMPRDSQASFLLAASALAISGAASAGWLVGDQRLLYVNVVPFEKRTEYMAIYYAWMGIVGGVGPIIAGAVIDLFQGLEGGWWAFTIDPYTPLFVAGLGSLGTGLFILSRIRVDGELGIGRIIGRAINRGRVS